MVSASASARGVTPPQPSPGVATAQLRTCWACWGREVLTKPPTHPNPPARMLLTSFRSRLILSALLLDRLTVVDSKAQSSSTVSMLHVLEGEPLVLVFGGAAVDVAGPSEALAEMCVCTARCCLRPVDGELPAAVVATCCCLPEKQGGQAGPLTKLSRHRLHAGVCIYACSRLLRTEPGQSWLFSVCYC